MGFCYTNTKNIDHTCVATKVEENYDYDFRDLTRRRDAKR
jgi:hypothetical protein